MSQLSYDGFLAKTRAWAGSRNTSFQYYWPVKGGWEGWIQVDLTANILSHESTIDILREQPVFENPRQLVDLLLNAEAPAAQVLVEIKAQSFQNHANFVPGVQEDIEKLSHRDNEHRRSDCVVLAVAFSREARDGVLQISPDGYPIFRDIYLSPEIAVLAAVWTATQGWIMPRTPVTLPTAEEVGSGA